MSYLKKFVILLVLGGFLYLIYQLMRQRQLLLAREGLAFSVPSKTNELATVTANTTPVGISNAPVPTKPMPIVQYCIKASYNTAFTGNYINKDMVKYVLQRGCRFLDFEIFPNAEAKDNINLIPTVSCHEMRPQSTETLYDILNTIGIYGYFQGTPNPQDPIFIHLRVCSQGNRYLYSQIAHVIHNSAISSKLYVDNAGKAIQLDPMTQNLDSSLNGKVIIVLEAQTAADYRDPQNSCATLSGNSSSPCYDLANYVNMITGYTNTVRTYSTLANQKLNSPTIRDDKLTTSVNSFNLVIPDNASSNYWVKLFGMSSTMPYYKLPLNYGIQVVMYPFYQNDQNLATYETMFANSGHAAFVPMATMITYIKKSIA